MIYKPMYVGLDISLTATGVVILDYNFNLISSTTIKIKKWQHHIERYNLIAQEAISFVNKNIQPDFPISFFIEGFSMNSRGRNILNMAENAGIIKHQIYYNFENNIKDFVIIPPATAKMIIAGHGRAQKEEMINALENKGYKLNNEHEYDACAMILTWFQLEENKKNNYNIIKK